MRSDTVKYLFFAMRPKQWIKNLLIFLPLVFGIKLLTFPANLVSLATFFLFSLSSSAVYLMNDIVDLEKDKNHPTKRLRPLPSGKISIRQAGVAAIGLCFISVILSSMLNIKLAFVIAIYIISNLLYSKIIKNIVILDVFAIGWLFLLRIIAGSIAAEVTVSSWIIIMTIFLALFLGFSKRRQDLKLFGHRAISTRPVLNKYDPYFLDQIMSVLTASVVVTYLFYALDEKTTSQFGNAHLVYSIPFVYYGIFRYLYLIHIVKKEGDPTRILLCDKMMQISIILWISVCVISIYGG